MYAPLLQKALKDMTYLPSTQLFHTPIFANIIVFIPEATYQVYQYLT